MTGHRLRVQVVVAVAASALAVAPEALASDLYVSNATGNRISPFSIQSDGTLAAIACSSNCATGDSPQGVAISPNAEFLYVADADTTGTISPFAITSGGSLAPIACGGANCTAGSYPYWLAVTPNGKFLYATNFSSDTVSPYKIGSNGSLTPIACIASACDTGHDPEEAAIAPNGRYLYVVNANGVLGRPSGVLARGSASRHGSVSVFSIASNGSLTKRSCTPRSRCALGEYPWASAITPNGRFLYVVNSDSDTISPFTIASNGALAHVACSGCVAGGDPYGIAVSPNGKFAYVPNNADGTVSPYAINANGSLTPITCAPRSNCSVGSKSGPTSATMSPNGKYLYVTTDLSSEVVVFAVRKDGSLSPVPCSGCGGLDGPEYGQSIVVTPDQAPTASFRAEPRRAHRRSKFNASASKATPGQQVATYMWGFGDGSHKATRMARVKHTYRKRGTYNVTLTVIDDAGCSTALVYTGQTAYCHGGPSARLSRRIVVK